jgi:inosose dehydratase
MLKTLGLGAGAACLAMPEAQGAPKRRLKIGQTSINWGGSPAAAEPGIRESAKLGYLGYESLGETLEAYEAKGGLGKLLDECNIPLPSTYLRVNLTDPAKKKDELAKMLRWGGILKKCGGQIAVLGPNHVDRATWDFKANKANIIAMLNEVGKTLDGIGLKTTIHQHTDTCIMTSDEVYATLEAVDTKYMGFGPDLAQLQKGGADPVKIAKDFAPIIRSVHLKDFLGQPYWAGYCPLGQGKVDIPTIMDVLETSAKGLEWVMVELDGGGRGAPMNPFDCAKTSKEYLVKLGYTFRS